VRGGIGGGVALEEALLPQQRIDEQWIKVARCGFGFHQIAVVSGIHQTAEEARCVLERRRAGKPPHAGRGDDRRAIQPDVAEVKRQPVLCQRIADGGLAQSLQVGASFVEVPQAQE